MADCCTGHLVMSVIVDAVVLGTVAAEEYIEPLNNDYQKTKSARI